MGDSTIKTLYNLLNQCRTSQGQRLLMKYIRQPLVDVNKIGLILFFFQINTLK
jgi:DNA mismatch repair ATPase MutS